MNNDTWLASPSPYQALSDGNIRTLCLLPGLPNAPLEAQLKRQPLDAAEDDGDHGQAAIEDNGFEAISYCWGTELSQQHLHLTNGSSLALTQSLYSALQAFRHTHQPRHLWADAVCINQDDVFERSSQVQMMGRIYAKARRVLVWLGPCLPDGTETIAFVTLTAPIVARGDRPRREILRIIERHLETATLCKCCHIAVSPSRRIRLEDVVAAVAKLFERPWFGRLWVVQEVALAAQIRVHCGSHFVSWEVFTEVLRALGQFEDDQHRVERFVPNTLPREELRQSPQSPPLERQRLFQAYLIMQRRAHALSPWLSRRTRSNAAEFRCRISQHDPQLLLVRGTFNGRIHVVLDGSACPSKHVHRRSPSKCPDHEAVALINWYVRCCHFLETNLLLGKADDTVGTSSIQSAGDIFGASHATIKTTERRLVSLDLLAKWLGQTSVETDIQGGLDELAQNLGPYITGYPYDREWNLCVVSNHNGFHAAWVPPLAKPDDKVCYFAAAPYPFVVRSLDGDNYQLIGDALVLGLEENDMLHVDPREWSVILDRARIADSNLKSWMTSARRAELKRSKDTTALCDEDQLRKSEVEAAVSRIKSLYRKADEQHQWIPMR